MVEPWQWVLCEWVLCLCNVHWVWEGCNLGYTVKELSKLHVNSTRVFQWLMLAHISHICHWTASAQFLFIVSCVPNHSCTLYKFGYYKLYFFKDLSLCVLRFGQLPFGCFGCYLLLNCAQNVFQSLFQYIIFILFDAISSIIGWCKSNFVESGSV